MADDDLASLAREDLVMEVMRLREGIRRHRDSTGHELCWAPSPALESLAGEDGSPADGARVAAFRVGTESVIW